MGHKYPMTRAIQETANIRRREVRTEGGICLQMLVIYWFWAKTKETMQTPKPGTQSCSLGRLNKSIFNTFIQGESRSTNRSVISALENV